LWDDVGGNWIGPVTPGSTGALTNQQCTINASTTTVASAINGSATGWTVTPAITFAGGFAGAKTIWVAAIDRANASSGWQQLGTWSVQSSAATVVLTDTTQSGPYFFSGDSFSLTVSGSRNQPVTVIQNGVLSSTIGYTDNNGVYATTGTWGPGTVGAWAQIWQVGGVPAPVISFEVLTLGDTSGPTSVSSYTGAPPLLPCNDITGNWISTPDSGLSGEWDLVQSGTNVSGTAYTGYQGCGLITYSVSGGFGGSGFSVVASNPTPSIDSCGLHWTPTDTHTITLSGNSCSAGSGHWSSDFQPSGGNVNWQVKSSSNSINTPATPHFKVEYAAYIAVDHVVFPHPCVYNGRGVSLLYLGDKDRGTHRAGQSLVVIPNAQWKYNFSYDVGQTRNYGFGSPVNGSTISSLDEDSNPDDCYLWNNSGYADPSHMTLVSVTYPYATQAQVHFLGYAGNPLELNPFPDPIGDINWDMNVVIDDSNPSAPTAQVAYSHTCYPAHIVKVNNTTVYEYLPLHDNAPYIVNCLSQDPVYGAKINGVTPSKAVGSQ
jgi:hypothetical protein